MTVELDLAGVEQLSLYVESGEPFVAGAWPRRIALDRVLIHALIDRRFTLDTVGLCDGGIAFAVANGAAYYQGIGVGRWCHGFELVWGMWGGQQAA